MSESSTTSDSGGIISSNDVKSISSYVKFSFCFGNFNPDASVDISINFNLFILASIKFANDKSKAIEYVNHELKKLKNINNYKYLLLLQPTSPFRKRSDFKKAFEMIKSNKCDTVITSKLVKEHPLLMHTYNNRVTFYTKNYKKAFSGRQGFPKIYLRQGAMYLTKISAFKKFKSLQGGLVKHIVVKGKYAVNIDDKEDLVLANHYFNKKL